MRRMLAAAWLARRKRKDLQEIKRSASILPICHDGSRAGECVEIRGANGECADAVAPEISALVSTADRLRRTLATDEQCDCVTIDLDMQVFYQFDVQRVGKPENCGEIQRELLLLAGESHKRRFALRAHFGALESNDAGDNRLVVGREVGD